MESHGVAASFPIGVRSPLGGRNISSLVFQTGRPARIDDYAHGSGATAELVHDYGIRAAVGVPICVEGRVWGVMIAGSTHEAPMPDDTEARLVGFTELVATAIANAQARVEFREYAEEQAALRRVATLVAEGASPEGLFAAVAAEAGQLLRADFAVLSRYEPDGATVVGGWGPHRPGTLLPRGCSAATRGTEYARPSPVFRTVD